MSRGEVVHRPRKKIWYIVFYGSSSAKKGWRDLKSIDENAMIEAWHILTETPLAMSKLCYPLSGEAAYVVRDGQQYQRWQLKLNLRSGVRIWYYVDGQNVIIERVHTHHPNETK